METWKGKSILNRTACGRIVFYEKEEGQVKRRRIEDTKAEVEKYRAAREKAEAELKTLYEKAKKEVGEVNAGIFEVHGMLLEDKDFNDSIIHIIETQKVNAGYAAAVTGDNFAKMFEEMEDEYFKARSADIKDISERLIRILEGRKENDMGTEEPVIIAAKDLAPSETVQMNKEKLLGFVTESGSVNSHTAILARTMNVPALMGIPVKKEWNGRMAVIDGETGELFLDPSEEIIERAMEREKDFARKQQLLAEFKGRESVTESGKKIRLYANIGNTGDVAGALANDAEGIGLFRSEFLYIGQDHCPTEEEQFRAYKSVAENMHGKPVIIRTLDIGADKQADYLGLEKEENPAMGYRAIRICLTRPEIFKTQLRAIYRAGMYGNISIMFPMIISVEEIRRIKEITAEVKKELSEDGISYREAELGVMIETPAAVMISEELAEEVDFFSIGTNDLTQYTLAIDRQNARLDAFYDAHHPAVLRMIRMVVENGHKHGCWVGICGELGADTELTESFLDMGVDELSVSPSAVLPIRKIIREHA